MTWDPTAWLIGGGALNSEQSARVLAYAAMNGGEGVVRSTDLRVRALDVPGGSIRVLPGVAAVPNRAPGVTSETYIARNPTEDVQPVSATGTGVARSDLVAVVVEDPFVPGTGIAKPADPTKATYVRTRLIPNVGTTVRRLQDVPGYENTTGYALARIDIPAATSAITSAMIVDLRGVANPRRQRTMLTVASTGLGDESQLQNGTAGGALWPKTAVASTAIPSWATMAYVRATLQGPRVVTGPTSGELWAKVGTVSTTVPTTFNEQIAGAARLSWLIGNQIAIPSSLRGTTQVLAIWGRKIAGSGALEADDRVQVFWDIEFVEGAE